MRVGRNEPCPCGSGKKAKKCCLADGPIGYSRADRTSARAKLLGYVAEHLVADDDAALDEFWAPLADLGDEQLDRPFGAVSDQFSDDWFMFDRPLETGEAVVDRFLGAPEAGHLTSGERNHLRAIQASTVRLYEVEDLSPGESLTLVDLIEGGRITVQERAGSRALHRYDWIAARVVVPGASGKPEIEGLIEVTMPYREALRAGLRESREAYGRELRGEPVEHFYRSMVPKFHEVWVRSILAPAVPKLANTDGDELVVTRVRFEVVAREALLAALDGAAELERDEGDSWGWSGKNAKGERVSLGNLTLTGTALELEVNSVARGARGRTLVEQLAGAAVKHRSTTHEDMQRLVRESMKKGGSTPHETGIPPELQEALALDYYAKHYREWLDLPVPALDNLTPRDASRRTPMRPRLVELLQGLDGMYQRSLEDNAPAFDPSWMWEELGLSDDAERHPPPLAFERVLAPEARAVIQRVAEGIRRAPGFKEGTVEADELRVNLEVQRFLREPTTDAAAIEPWLPRLVNFELHRRKAFWVDEALAYMLAGTELDVRASELQVPFASFALVFTDRHVLSMAERLLARQKGVPLRGRYVRALTVFVTEHGQKNERSLDVCFAFDALGADLPVCIAHYIALTGDAPVQGYLELVAPLALEQAAAHTNPLRGLLQVVLNAVLYATSAGVVPEVRPAAPGAAARPRARGGPPQTFSSDEVFYLPGAIEISQVRRLQELERHSEGRGVLRRFMVRGHWRRARAGAVEQRMSWVRPHWKGPDLATVIERTYKLKP